MIETIKNLVIGPWDSGFQRIGFDRNDSRTRWLYSPTADFSTASKLMCFPERHLASVPQKNKGSLSHLSIDIWYMIYIYIHTYVYIYVYIYIWEGLFRLFLSFSIQIYISYVDKCVRSHTMVITRLGGEPRVKNATGAPHVNASDEKRRTLPVPQVDQFIGPGWPIFIVWGLGGGLPFLMGWFITCVDSPVED